jgi:hypothetical protein
MLGNPAEQNRRTPFLSSPPISATPLNPTKQTTNTARKVLLTLHAIKPQKRTIEVVLRRANTMRENIRKIVAAARKAGCPILAVPSSLRQGRDTTKASPPSPKRREKCRKSAQITPGNHPTTPNPSTTYKEFYAKTPHPPPFFEKTQAALKVQARRTGQHLPEHTPGDVLKCHCPASLSKEMFTRSCLAL